MRPNMINRLVVPFPVNQLLFSLLSLYHSDTDRMPINPFSLLFSIPRRHRLMGQSYRHYVLSEYIFSVSLALGV